MSFTAWIMSITGVICLSVFADILMADGSTKKYVKSISALIVFAVIISPLPTILNQDFDFTKLLPKSEYNETFVTNINEERFKNAEEALEKALATKGYDNSDVQIYYDVNRTGEIYSVVVFLDNNVINSNKENININDDIATFVANALNVDKRNVIVTY